MRTPKPRQSENRNCAVYGQRSSFLSRRKARGFSRLELVTLLGIVVLLVPPLLAAVQSSREAARRTQCLDRLGQIGIALHNYQETYGCFAPGWAARFPQGQSASGYGWQASLLSYIEQGELFQKVEFKKPLLKPTPQLETALAIYRCPSDMTEKTNAIRGGYGTSNYSGNFGSKPVPRWAPGPLADYWPGALDSPEKTNGVFWMNSRFRMRDFLDGAAYTIAVGERCLTSGAGIWPGVTSNQNENDVVTVASAENTINSGFDSYSSFHVGGANFAMGDGSARFISANVLPETFQLLGGTQDLKATPEDF